MTASPRSAAGAVAVSGGSTETSYGRFGAGLLIAASVWMGIGGANQGISGVDYWVALEDDALADALAAVADKEAQLQLTHVMWALGMLAIVVAMTLVRRYLRTVADHPLLDAGFHVIVMGATFNVVSYIAMASATTTYAGTEDVAGAEGVLRLGLRLDDYATLLVLGLGPLLLILSGRGVWAPRWLLVLGCVALVANVGYVASAFVGGAAIAIPPAVVFGLAVMIGISARVLALARGAGGAHPT